MSKLEEISQDILDNYDFNQYQGMSVEVDPPEIDAMKCLQCGRHAPLGVPIKHADDCGAEEKEMTGYEDCTTEDIQHDYALMMAPPPLPDLAEDAKKELEIRGAIIPTNPMFEHNIYAPFKRKLTYDLEA